VKSARPVSPGMTGDELRLFFGLLDAAPSSLLLLDYDGTLAPFREDPAVASPYPQIAVLLRDILRTGLSRTVIVTGRSLASIIPLLDFRPIPEIWASHGREHRLPGGEIRRIKPTETQREGLAEALRAGRSSNLPGRLEEKPFSAAFHVRGLSNDIGERSLVEVRRVWRPVALRVGFSIQAFDGGIEIRAPGRSKGDAVEELLAETPAGTPAAYLGDDETDEDAFRALGSRGLSVLVRREWRPTHARAWLRPPEEVQEFLERWLRACGG